MVKETKTEKPPPKFWFFLLSFRNIIIYKCHASPRRKKYTGIDDVEKIFWEIIKRDE